MSGDPRSEGVDIHHMKIAYEAGMYGLPADMNGLRRLRTDIIAGKIPGLPLDKLQAVQQEAAELRRLLTNVLKPDYGKAWIEAREYLDK